MKKNSLPRVVVWLGFVSLLTDVGTEMIYPLLPMFLVGRAARAAHLHRRRRGRRRSHRVAAQAGLGPHHRSAAAAQAAHRARLRFVVAGAPDRRASPRIRGTCSPRASPIASARAALEPARRAPRRRRAARDPRPRLRLPPGDGQRRRASSAPSLRRCFCTSAGSCAAVLLLSAVPGALAMCALVFGVREPERERHRRKSASGDRPRRRGDAAFARRKYLVAVALFGLGNSSDAFLLLRAEQCGVAVKWMPLLWMAHNASKAALSTWAGALSDRVGRRARHRQRLGALRPRLPRVRLRLAGLADLGALRRLRRLLRAHRRRREGARRRSRRRPAPAGAPSAGTTPPSASPRCRRRSASARSPIASARACRSRCRRCWRRRRARGCWWRCVRRRRRRRRRLADVDLRQLVDARHHHHLDAAVERAALGRVVLGERVELRVARRGEPARIDAFAPVGSARP